MLEDVEKPGRLRAFVSFYNISNVVIGNPKHSELLASFLWMYAAEDDEMLRNMVNDAMICAKNVGSDVFNCLNIMRNETFLDDLKFNAGDGDLNFYLYNWKCPPVAPNKEVRLVNLLLFKV